MNLVGGEAVEESVSTRAHQIFLAAASASVRRILRSGMLASTGPIVMPCPGAALAVARPVVAGRVLVSRESGAVELRTGQNIVPIGFVSTAVDDLAFFVGRVFFRELVVVAVQVVYVARHLKSLGVVPGPAADPVTGVYAPCTCGAEVRAPGLVSNPDVIGQLLTVRVGSCEAS